MFPQLLFCYITLHKHFHPHESRMFSPLIIAHNLSIVKWVALASLLPDKFIHSPCCYYWFQETENYGLGMNFSCVFTPMFSHIDQQFQIMNGGKVELWFHKRNIFVTRKTSGLKNLIFFCGAAAQRGPWPHYWGFLITHTQRRTTVGRTTLDEWWARRRDVYMTTHKHPCHQWDSNPQSQQASGRRPTP